MPPPPGWNRVNVLANLNILSYKKKACIAYRNIDVVFNTYTTTMILGEITVCLRSIDFFDTLTVNVDIDCSNYTPLQLADSAVSRALLLAPVT